MSVDLLSGLLRGLSFVALAQTAGGVLFLALFGARLEHSQGPMDRSVRTSAITALVLLPTQFALEAGRMAGSFGGVLDARLQVFAITTPGALVLALRMIAMAIVVAVPGRLRGAGRPAGILAVLTVGVSFALTGHATLPSLHWLLRPVLVLHVLIACFWFGALSPLAQVVRHESAALSAAVVARFSAVAGWLVPLILVAGLILAAGLLPDVRALKSPYGRALVAKVGAFAVLMGLALLNRRKLGPALSHGNPRARDWFRRVVFAEWILLATVLVGTAFLTTFLSPD